MLNHFSHQSHQMRMPRTLLLSQLMLLVKVMTVKRVLITDSSNSLIRSLVLRTNLLHPRITLTTKSYSQQPKKTTDSPSSMPLKLPPSRRVPLLNKLLLPKLLQEEMMVSRRLLSQLIRRRLCKIRLLSKELRSKKRRKLRLTPLKQPSRLRRMKLPRRPRPSRKLQIRLPRLLLQRSNLMISSN